MACELECDRFPVVDDEGEVLFWTGEEEARSLIEKRKATLQMVGRIRLLRVTNRRTPRSSIRADWAAVGHSDRPPHLSDGPQFDAIARRERKEIFAWISERLSKRHVALLRLLYWNDLNYSQASEAMGVTPPAASAMHERVLDRIWMDLRSLGIARIEHI